MISRIRNTDYARTSLYRTIDVHRLLVISANVCKRPRKWNLLRTFLRAQRIITPQVEIRISRSTHAAVHKGADARSKISPSLSPGHVRDFLSRVIFRGCAARVGMSAGTQADTKGYVYLQLARGIFPSLSSLPLHNFIFLSLSLSLSFSRSITIELTIV